MYVISFRQRSMSSSYRQFGSVGLAGTVRTECRLKSVLVYRIIVSIPSVAVPLVTAYLFSFITFGHNNQLVIDKIGHPLCVVKRTAYQRRPPKAFHKELYTKLSQQIITGEIVGVIVGQFATLYLHLVAAFPDIVVIFQGIPVGQEVEGAATKATRVPDRRADLVAGRQVYQAQCVACHGPDGQGVRAGAAGSAQGYVFPPLWGKDSFNNGAGMNRLLTATRFIRHNMPQGTTFKAPVLTDDEAFDVAAYVLSQPRPVKAGLDKDFPARWNKPVDAAFPPYVDGAPADQHRFGPYPPLLEAAKKRQPN